MKRAFQASVRRTPNGPARFGWAALILATLSLSRVSHAQEIRYFYDDLNRLVGVVDPQGNAAEYIYDAAGNILQIKRFNVDASAPVSITLVKPSQGLVGTVVEIFGKGFSATPGDNQVAFNGTAATVTTATATSLTTKVPSGATTGPISVTTPLGSAVSPEPFTVLAGLAVIPNEAAVPAGGTLGFQATLGGTPTTLVTWRVNGIIGGNATLGTISPAGVYTAPSTAPAIQPVAIEAALIADPTQVVTASVRVVGQAADLILAAPVAVGPSQPKGALALSGPLAVGVTAPQGAQALSGPLSLTGGPVVAAVAPATGTVGSTLAVTLTGANLQGASAIQAVQDSRVDSTLTASNITPAAEGTTVTFTLAISPSASPGPRVLQVMTPQGTSSSFDTGTNRFTVTP